MVPLTFPTIFKRYSVFVLRFSKYSYRLTLTGIVTVWTPESENVFVLVNKGGDWLVSLNTDPTKNIDF